MTSQNFILASGSPQRKLLLEQIGFIPKLIEPADIDEAPRKHEKPSTYVKRMALEKGLHVAGKHPGEIILACDTVVVCGQKIIQKAHDDSEQEKIMRLLSGKPHRVMSAVCVIDNKGKAALKLNTTKILMKNLTEKEIKAYIASHEWVGCAGYKIEGRLAAFVRKLTGSYSGVVGLPLYETRNMLISAGLKEEK